MTTPAAGGAGGGLLVATDLDGTLLDEETYAYDAALEALSALRAGRIPLVLASSKTRAEMEPLARGLGLDCALIVENGGAVVLPPGLFTWAPASGRRGETSVIELGVAREVLVRQLESIAEETGTRLPGFASLSLGEVAELTGFGPEQARLACERCYDEPFLMDDPQRLPEVAGAARRRGLSVSRGGRFFHLSGAADKGQALRVLLRLYPADGRSLTTVGLGDAANDLPLLLAVSRPIVVPRPGGAPDPDLAAALPGAERAPWPGPAGWNAAVLAVLAGERLPGLWEVAG